MRGSDKKDKALRILALIFFVVTGAVIAFTIYWDITIGADWVDYLWMVAIGAALISFYVAAYRIGLRNHNYPFVWRGVLAACAWSFCLTALGMVAAYTGAGGNLKYPTIVGLFVGGLTLPLLYAAIVFLVVPDIRGSLLGSLGSMGKKELATSALKLVVCAAILAVGVVLCVGIVLITNEIFEYSIVFIGPIPIPGGLVIGILPIIVAIVACRYVLSH